MIDISFWSVDLFFSRMCLQPLVGGVTEPCIAQCASLSDAVTLIIVSLKTFYQVPSKDVETATFLSKKGL